MDAQTETKLWTADGFRDDPWRHAEVFEAGANERTILPLAAYLALDDETRRAGADRLGVSFLPAEPVSAIEPYLTALPLVALVFPAFNDGRSYSKAELLRRAGFGGTLRATGDVLIDQIALMQRVGFDEFEISNTTALKRLEAGRSGGLPLYYQPAGRDDAAGETYSWRRRPSRG